jgi:large subunit ribosomal protein L15
MKNLNEVKKIVEKSAKRLGRGMGSGKGTKSGRGTTRHQTAREKIPLHFEGGQNRLVKRFPLIRGKSKNKPVNEKPVLITLNHLNKFEKNDKVNMQSLLSKNIIDLADLKRGVKLVANGNIENPLEVEIPMSSKARSKIEKAGGKAQ